MNDSNDLDLRHLPYMPLKIDRLRRSKAWLRCKRRPELGFYMLNLWMRSWHEVPAGTIEADDDVLADAAMCSPEQWQVMKDDLLRGWELRGDRYQHPIVTEIATEAVGKLNRDRSRTEAAREAKRQAMLAAAAPTVTEPATSPVTEIATEAVTGAKVEEEGKEKEESASAASSARAAATTGEGRPKPREDLDQLEAKLREAAGLESDPSPGLLVLGPIRGLLDAGASLEQDILPVIRSKAAAGKRGRSWGFYVPAITDNIEARRKSATVVPMTESTSRETPRHVWAIWLGGFKANGSWLHRLGPKPTEAGCRAPPDLLAEHDFPIISRKEIA